jgi:hypothetical protein
MACHKPHLAIETHVRRWLAYLVSNPLNVAQLDRRTLPIVCIGLQDALGGTLAISLQLLRLLIEPVLEHRDACVEFGGLFEGLEVVVGRFWGWILEGGFAEREGKLRTYHVSPASCGDESR